MHITFIALGSLGDVLPYLTLAQALSRAGHEIRFATFENFEPLVEQRRLTYHLVRGDSTILVEQAGANMASLVRVFASLANSYAHDFSAPELLETDLIVNQLPLALFGYDLAEKAGVRMVQAAVLPVTRTEAFPSMAFRKSLTPGLNRLSHLAAEQVGWQLLRRSVNRWRRETLALKPLPLAGYFSRLGTPEYPVLYGFSELVVPRPPDWSSGVHITGYWFPKETKWQPSAALLAFLESGPPPVFMSFGSMPLPDPQETFHIIFEALGRAQQRAVLQIRQKDIHRADWPARVLPITYAPYDWLLPRMALTIHHGGSGTTGFGLLAGVPSLVIPLTFDQHFWARRLAELGVGPEPIPFRKLNRANLSVAILEMVDDHSMRRKAAQLGQTIRAEDGLGNAVGIIESLATI